MQMISCNNNMTPLSPTETGSYLLPLSGKICKIYPISASTNNQRCTPNLWLLVGMYYVITDLAFAPTNDSSVEMVCIAS